MKMDIVNTIAGSIFLILSGIFAWESTKLVDAQKRSRRNEIKFSKQKTKHTNRSIPNRSGYKEKDE